MTTTPIVIVVGVDIGADSTKVVLGPNQGCEIVRNDVGGHTTPTVVALGGDGGPKQPRQIGMKSNAKHAMYHLNRLLPDELSANKDDVLQPFYTFQVSSEGTIDNVPYNGTTESFSTAAVLGMLLGKLQQNAKSTLERQQGEKILSSSSMALSIACPRDLSSAGQQEILDAAYAAGIDSVQLVDRSVAYQATYGRKFPEHLNKYVLIVDMGHADTTISLIGPTKTVENSDDKQEEKEEKEKEKAEEKRDEELPPAMTVLATQRHVGLGAGVVDVRLWNHFQSTHPKLGGGSLTPTSRGGQRLLAGMSKLKHLLSQLPEGNVTVENVGENDTDVSLEATRKLLVDLCSEEVQALTTLVEQVLSETGVEASQLYSVEVLGGGCRMPWVKEVLEKVTQKSLSYTLDDTSAAMGAASVSDQQTEKGSSAGILASRTPQQEPTERQISLRAVEEGMAKVDEELRLRSSILNQMESHILALRSAKHEPHGELLPAELVTYLDTMEDWLFSPEADNADYQQLETKWQEVQDQTGEFSRAFTETREADRKAKEAEMEAEAKQAQIEREGEENGEDDDHDYRRLPKKRRMEIVMKNKKEGGELFSDGNFSRSGGLWHLNMKMLDCHLTTASFLVV